MARPVRIVVDSTFDFSPEEAAALGLTVVPLMVRFGDETFEDRVTISPTEFYAKLATAHAMPTTSQPTPAKFAEVYKRLLDDGSDVLSLHISSALSGTYNSANVAREHVDSTRIATIDTHQVSLGAQPLARAAVRALAEGRSLSELVDLVNDMWPRVHVIATLGSLEHLRRGGRIGRLASLVGGMLSVKVLITVKDGIVAPLEKVRTRQRALLRVEELILEQAPYEGPLLIGHCDDLATAEVLVNRLRAVVPSQEIIIHEIGPVVGTHAGPGTVGAGVVAAKRPS